MFRPVRDAFCCAAVLLAVAVGPAPATAQAPAAPRIFAAQTGPDQVTLAWESVPGATEYRIYLGNPEVAGAPALTSRPLYRLGGSSRRVLVNGVRRLAGGAYLLALAGGQVLFRGTFNAVTPAPLAPVTPPAAVQAVESGPTEVTVSWTPVIGATAYMISRAVGGWGLSKLCDFCPPTPRLVDRNATPGLAHLYTVQAIFPLGISTRTASNRLTVGGAQLATASTGTLTGPISTMMTAGGTGTWDGGVGASAGGSSTGTTGTTTSTTTPTGGATTAAALMPPQRVTADALRAAAGTAYVSWGASPSSGVTGYILYRSINGGTFAPVRQGGTSMLSVTDTAFGGVPFGATPVMATYYVVTLGQASTTSAPSVTTAPVQVQPDYRVVLMPPKQVSADGLRAGAGTGYVSWGPSPSSGVTGYILYRSINGGTFAPVRQGDTSMLSVTDTAFGGVPFGAAPVMAAYYVVTTGQGGTTSGPSVTTAPVQIQPDYRVVLLPPKQVNADGLRAAAGTGYVSWGPSPSSGVTGYILYRSINGGTFASVRQGDTNLLSVTDTAFGGIPFGATPVMASYYVVALGQGGATSGPSITTAPIQIQPDYRGMLVPPKQVTADGQRAAPGTAYVYWGPSPSSGVTGYILYRTINGGPFAPVRQGGAALLSVTDTAFGAAPFAAGPVIAAYYVVVTGEGGATSGPSVTTAPVQIQAPYGPKVPTGGTTGGATGSTPAPAPPSCKLDYQRADNMWAAFGQPSGALGTESIALANGQTKTFVTDWAFEKKRNDGTTYYGSHLRVATNPGAGVILLHVRNPLSALIAGIAPDVQSTATGWLTIKPGVRAEFRDDLVEVHCGP